MSLRAMNQLRLTWNKGGEAAITKAKGDMVSVRSSISSPPGSRLEGRAVVDTPEGEPTPALAGEPVMVKVHGCKRQPDGWFVLEGRVFNASRLLLGHLVHVGREAD